LKTFGQVLQGVHYVERPGAYAFILNEKREIAVVQTSFGYFLPGGGLDRGEDELTGLQRELREEIGYEIVNARFLMRAAQYHWSEFYQSHFKKIGAFFEVEAKAPDVDSCAHGHALVWMPLDRAPADLSQEFQRWAAEEFAKQNLVP
jgi:8-oxo-dGTP diphosphatase